MTNHLYQLDRRSPVSSEVRARAVDVIVLVTVVSAVSVMVVAAAAIATSRLSTTAGEIGVLC